MIEQWMSNKYKRVKSIFKGQIMYKSGPSKQQQKKGRQLMKNLMMSQRSINQHSAVNIKNQQSIWSSTSLITKGKDKNSKEVNLSGLNMGDKGFVKSDQLMGLGNKKDQVVGSGYKDNPQVVRNTMGNYSKANKVNESIKGGSRYIKNSQNHKMTQNKQRQTHFEQTRIKTQANDGISKHIKLWLSRSTQKLFIHTENAQFPLLNSKSKQNLEQSKLTIPLTRSLTIQPKVPQQKTDSKHNLTLSDNLSQQLYLPIKPINSHLIQIPKLATHYKKAKQKTTFQNIQKLQKQLVIQRQDIKKARRQFMEVFENGKKFNRKYDSEIVEINAREGFILESIQKIHRQTLIRGENKRVVEVEVGRIQEEVIEERQLHNSKKSLLQQQILSRQQQNSAMARRIYQLKTHLNSVHEQRLTLNYKDKRNKSIIQEIIKKQQAITELKQQKCIILKQEKERQKQYILEQIQRQDKTEIYQRLDSQLNLIKQYFKISENAKQFKRNIKKLTEFATYPKQLESFSKSLKYSQELMHLYRSSLWNTQMPKFFQSQPLILESPKIRQLKNNYKQLQLKRQSLNQYVKEKQKVVDSLTYRCQKLVEQIQHLTRGNNQSEDQEQGNTDIDKGAMLPRHTITTSINWGF